MPLDTQPKAKRGRDKLTAWGKVPEDLVRNPDVNEAMLVLTAYRSTFSKSYVLREGELLNNPPVKPGTGLGKNVIRRTISWMRKTGIIKRRQPWSAGKGAYGPTTEELTLEIPAQGWLTVFRKWFDATLSLRAMAAWLYVMVGTGKGPVVWAREIRDRFGWDPKTCGKVVGELDEAGLLATAKDRSDGGRYRGIGYQAEKWDLRGSRSRGSRKAGNILKTPFTEDLPTNPLGEARESHERYYAPHASREEALPFSCELNGQRLEEHAIEERTAGEIHYGAIMDKTLLGWIDEHTLTEAVFDGGPYEEHLEAVCALASDAELRQRLLQAADGRIGRRLLGPEGLHTVRWLAAAMVREPGEALEAVTPAKALAAVLVTLEARIGHRPGQWLNSWELIGHRLAGSYYSGGEVDAAFAKAPATSPLLGILIGADEAKALGAGLKSDATGLAAFVQEQAVRHSVSIDQVGEIMRSTLATRGLFGDIARGAIKSWRYFEGPIADELRRIELSETGVRPGDVLGEHMRRAKGA